MAKHRFKIFAFSIWYALEKSEAKKDEVEDMEKKDVEENKSRFWGYENEILYGRCANCGHEVFVEFAGQAVHNNQECEDGETYCGAKCEGDGDICECTTPQLEIDYKDVSVSEIEELRKEGHEFYFDADKKKMVQILEW